METYLSRIEDLFARRASLSAQNVTPEERATVDHVIAQLNQGEYRVAVHQNGQWQVHEWLKKAILLYFIFQTNQVMDAGFTQFYDKLPLKYAHSSPDELRQMGVRIVPPAVARFGAYIAPNVILMPSYVNIGAYIDSGTMIDTWATIGSCAQIGKNVHISGGVGIGGVLEPLQAAPTIIEDDCFIGARSEIVEGVIVGQGAVISMGVFIGQSTPIYNRMTQEITYGRVPPNAVVVPGSLPARDGTHSLYAAVIVKMVDEKTRSKTALNDLLRNLYEGK